MPVDVQLSLKQSQWQKIRQFFHPAAKTPDEEREKIGSAIAQLEQFIGKMTGTNNDKGANESSSDPRDRRMDCIDESTNSTSYLFMMQQDGLLKWHRLEDPVTRGFFFFGWPHTTAVIQALDNQSRWAVDSWFHDNGIAPEIIPLKQWKDGWSPSRE